MRRDIRTGIALTLAVATLLYPTTVLAQEATGTATEGAVAGQVDGRANTSGCLWFGAGCLFSYFGVGAAYLNTPNPPATRLLGRSVEYVAAYSDAYAASAKNVQTSNARWGCILANTIGWGLYVVAVGLGASISQMQ